MKKGGGFEELISRLLRSGGFDNVTTMEPPVRILKHGGGGVYTVVFSSHGVLDFAGPVCGIHVEFDCKDIKGRRFPFSTIKKHQVERIRSLTVDGSLTGIVLRLRADEAKNDRLYGIPGFTLLNSIEAGDKSLSIDDLDEMADLGSVTRLAYFKPRLLEEFFENCSNLRYILPANFLKRGYGKPWHHRKDSEKLSISSMKTASTSGESATPSSSEKRTGSSAAVPDTQE